MVRRTSDFYLLNTGVSVIVVAVVACLSLFKVTFSWYSVIVGIIFGVIIFLFTLLNSIALKEGPISYTNVIINMSTVVTALSGWLFWDEELNVFMIIGIVLMAGCMVFSNVGDGTERKAASKKWLLLTVLSMLLSACTGLCQKVHQSSQHSDEIYLMLIVAFVVGSVTSFSAWGILRKRENASGVEATSGSLKRYIGCYAAIGLTYGTTHVLNLYLSGVINSAVFFPIINGIPLVLIIVLSFVFFKERLTKKQLVGIGLGILSLVSLCISKL